MTTRLFSTIFVFAIATLAGVAGSATAQTPGPSSAAAAPTVRIANPKRETLIKLMKPVDIAFEETRLEDAIDFIRTQSGVDMEVIWSGGSDAVGLDRDKPITLRANRVTALDALERVLFKTGSGSEESTWQLGDSGELQVGLKESLNKFRRMELYDVSDLLLEMPDYDRVPSIDLQTALQSSQGGGGNPFRDDQDDSDRRRTERAARKLQRGEEIIDLITELVETTQWERNGGTATIRYYQGQIIVNAPDYIHRSLAGYPFWPSGSTSVAMVEGRRYVKLGIDPSISTIDGFAQTEATAVVGGQIIKSGGGR